MPEPERKEKNQHVVIKDDEGTTVWEKNSAGCTTEEGYSRYDDNTGVTTNYWGGDKGNANNGK